MPNMLDIYMKTHSCNHNEENQKLLFSLSNGSVILMAAVHVFKHLT